ncbi:hypothetical protein MRB53_027436 [Persea americana]|uniref:Uncharacterized protein n=1 Tax=Persea americana TaxID=3435 RepID=A0ACC2LLE9_PERAE|nr:hypothetical protein MRB53_027436 [Persea americana]
MTLEKLRLKRDKITCGQFATYETRRLQRGRNSKRKRREASVARNGTEMETETETERAKQRKETTKLVLSPLRFPPISNDNGTSLADGDVTSPFTFSVSVSLPPPYKNPSRIPSALQKSQHHPNR